MANEHRIKIPANAKPQRNLSLLRVPEPCNGDGDDQDEPLSRRCGRPFNIPPMPIGSLSPQRSYRRIERCEMSCRELVRQSQFQAFFVTRARIPNLFSCAGLYSISWAEERFYPHWWQQCLEHMCHRFRLEWLYSSFSKASSNSRILLRAGALIPGKAWRKSLYSKLSFPCHAANYGKRYSKEGLGDQTAKGRSKRF